MGELQPRVGPSEICHFISFFMTIIQYLINIFLENMWNKNENGFV